MSEFNNLISMLNDKNDIILSQQAKIDALQKRIDEALQFAQDAHSDLNIGMLKMVQILKGESE